MGSYTYTDFDGLIERQADGDITLDTDLEAIKNSIQNILSTRKGSRRMLPEFGSMIEYMLFEPMDEITARKIGNEIVVAITKWEPRVDLRVVDVTADYDGHLYEVDIEYSIKGFGPGGQDTLRIILKRL